VATDLDHAVHKPISIGLFAIELFSERCLSSRLSLLEGGVPERDERLEPIVPDHPPDRSLHMVSQ
jgi:hypothetical protein